MPKFLSALDERIHNELEFQRLAYNLSEAQPNQVHPFMKKLNKLYLKAYPLKTPRPTEADYRTAFARMIYNTHKHPDNRTWEQATEVQREPFYVIADQKARSKK